MTSLPRDEVLYSFTENLAEPRSKELKRLKGFSKIFIAKKREKKFPLKLSDMVRLRPGLYAKIRRKKFDPFIPSLDHSIWLTLIPRRDITQLNKIEENSFQGNKRRYILVLYNPFKLENQRRAFSRLVQRTPMIRIRPGILLLPQIRTNRIRLYIGSLIRPSEFLSRLLDLGTPVWYLPRLELIGSSPNELITQLIQSTLEKRSQRILDSCHTLYRDIRTFQLTNSKQNSFKRAFLRLRSQAYLIRKQSQFFRNELRINLTILANRIASAITRVKHQLEICDN